MDTKIQCRLCYRETEKCFEIFSEQGITWKIASIVSTHFWFEVIQTKTKNNQRQQSLMEIFVSVEGK